MKHKIVLIHASRASLDPLMRCYPRAAPEIGIVNLLDDGVMGLFASGGNDAAVRRLADMIRTGREVYAAELALLCCSAVTRSMLEELRSSAAIPVVKIDVPMAAAAVRAGSRIGVIVTFPPTLPVTRSLLAEAADEAGAAIEVREALVPDALDALLAGDAATHDRLLLEAGGRLAEEGAEVIVLAQVSMAHLVEPLRARARRPVLSSLETSLLAVRAVLGLASGEP
jgi:Asp/Glu/hydantoin racemase